MIAQALLLNFRNRVSDILFSYVEKNPEFSIEEISTITIALSSKTSTEFRFIVVPFKDYDMSTDATTNSSMGHFSLVVRSSVL